MGVSKQEHRPMAGWQVTATSIYCDAIDDDVVIIINNDWTTRCTGYKKYGENITKEIALMLKKKSKKLGKELRCEGPLDYRVTSYRDKLIAEEKTKAKKQNKPRRVMTR
jgi:hypothetical protein